MNPDLIRGIGKYSRSQMYHKRGLWAINAKKRRRISRHDTKFAAEKPAEKALKFYSADEVKKLLVKKCKPRPTKLRESITPGSVQGE